MTVLQKISMQLHRVFSSDRKSRNPVKRSLIFSYVNIFLLPSSISLMIVAFLLDFLSLTFHLKPKAKISACTDFSDSVFQNSYLKICPFQCQNIKGIFLEWFLCSWLFDFCTKDVEKILESNIFFLRLARSTLVLIPLLGIHEFIFTFITDEQVEGLSRHIRVFIQLTMSSFHVSTVLQVLVLGLIDPHIYVAHL